MNINSAFPSKYVKASDIPEEGVSLVIDRVEIEDVDGKGTHKPVLYFRNAKKGMALNVTNSKKIAVILGTEETDEWGGHRITLYQSETEYQGDTVPCIRVRDPKGKRPAPKPAPPPEEAEYAPDPDDSDIPF